MTDLKVMLSFFEILLVLLSQLTIQASSDSRNLTFLSYFPCTDLPDGNATYLIENCDLLTYVAAELAVEEINSNEDVLNGSFVNLVSFATRKDSTLLRISADSEAVVFQSATYLIKLETIHGVVGPDDLEVTEIIAPLVSNYSSAVQILYEVANINYPYLFSPLPSNVFLNEARLSLLNKFQWIRLATLASSEKTYQQAHENFNKVFQLAMQPNLRAVVESFVDSPDSALQEIQRSGTKFIFGFFGPSDARKVLCRARLFGLTTNEHVWILPSYYDPGWWQLEVAELALLPDGEKCSNQEMEGILESTLFLGVVKFSLVNEVPADRFYSKLTAKALDLFPDLTDVDLSPLLLTSRARRAYEAVWLLALAWNSNNSTLQSKESQRDALNQSVWATMYCEWCRMYSQCFEFTDNNTENDCRMCLMDNEAVKNGILDNSVLNPLPHYYGQVLLSQFVGSRHCPLGFFWPRSNVRVDFVRFSDLDSHCLSPQLQEDASIFTVPGCPTDFTWKGGSRPTVGFSLTIAHIKLGYLVSVTILAFCCFAAAIVLLVLHFVWRKNKHIKASSPKLNVVIITGYMLYLPVPLLWGWGVLSGIKYNLSLPEITACCQLAEWMVRIAPVMMFSTLLVKNWRIYQIFHNKKLSQEFGKLHSDTVLLGVVAILSMPVVTIMIVWTVVDPYVAIKYLTKTSEDITDSNYINVSICVCAHYNIWNACILVYTLLLIVILLFYAFQNTKISTSIKSFQTEGIVSFRSLILVLFFDAVLYIVLYGFFNNLNHQFEIIFWILTVGILLFGTILLAVIFTPKFYAIYQDHVKNVRQRKQTSEAGEQERKYECLTREAQKLKTELITKEKKIILLLLTENRRD